MKKWSLLLAMILVFSTFLSACGDSGSGGGNTAADSPAATDDAGDSGDTGTAPPASSGDQIVMRVTWWGSQTRHDLTQEAIQLYMERNPNIRVDSEFSAWDGYWERLAAQIAGNNLSDVFQQDYAYLQQYADNGIMLDLTPYMGNGFDTTYIEENTLQGGAVDGKIYAISLGLNSQCVVWDPELFEQAGVDAPPDRWTWAEYIDTATKLHEALGIYGEEHFASSFYHGLNLWMRQHGVSVYGADGLSLGYDDDQLFADYFQMDLDMTNAGVNAPADIRDEIISPEDQLIVTQRAAMMGSLGGSNQLAAVNNAAGRELKLATLPMIEGEPSGQFLKPSQYFSVYSGTSIPDESVDFINFITNDHDANQILMAERGVPISSDIRDLLAPMLDETQQEIFRYIDHVSTFAHPIGLPEPASHAELEPILKNIRFDILTGSTTPLEGAERFRSEAERVFASQQR